MLVLMLGGCQESGRPDKRSTAEVGARADGPKEETVLPPWLRALPKAELKIDVSGGATRSLSVRQLSERFGVKTVQTTDPYYHEKKSFYGIPLAPFLADIFKSHDLVGTELMFEALDGYSVRLSGELATHRGAYLAFAEVGTGGLPPIGEQKVAAGPLYLVWEGDELTDLKTHPRPWGLARIRLLSSADDHKHLTPPGGFGSNTEAKKGFELFEEDCLRCHAINQEGGKLGPELNVPQNILAYREEKQVRQFIRNPRAFRYSAMPPHPDLTEADLDALIAYLRLMEQHQYDPSASSSP
jgi:cytochrome c2